MNVIPPLGITAAMLTSTTIIEVAPAAYNAGTTYASGNTVSVAGAAGLQSVYQSLQSANTGNTPASSPTWWVYLNDTYQAWLVGTTYALNDYAQDNTTHLVYQSLVASNTGNALTNTTKWVQIGPTNSWSMFDTLRNTASVAAGTTTIVLTPGVRFDSLACMGLVNVNTITIGITSTVGGGTAYTETINLNTRNVYNWYDYFFQPFTTQGDQVRTTLPPYTDAIITVTFTATSGNAQIGALILGLATYLGGIQYNAVDDVLNFSTVNRDVFGGISSIVQRRNVPKTIQQVWCPKSRIASVRAVRDLLPATPAVWEGITDNTDGMFESVLILGFYKKFSIDLAHQDAAIISLELEEV